MEELAVLFRFRVCIKYFFVCRILCMTVCVYFYIQIIEEKTNKGIGGKSS